MYAVDDGEESWSTPKRLYSFYETRSKELADETYEMKSLGKDWNIM